MRKRYFIVSVVLLPVLTVSLTAQISKPDSKNFLLDVNRPFVYANFDRIAPGIPRNTNEPKSRIWLRLRNNCRIAVVVRVNGLPPLEAKPIKTRLLPLWDQSKEVLIPGEPAWKAGMPVRRFRVVLAENYEAELAKEKLKWAKSPAQPQTAAPPAATTTIATTAPTTTAATAPTTPLEQAIVDWAGVAADENDKLEAERRECEEALVGIAGEPVRKIVRVVVAQHMTAIPTTRDERKAALLRVLHALGNAK